MGVVSVCGWLVGSWAGLGWVRVGGQWVGGCRGCMVGVPPPCVRDGVRVSPSTHSQYIQL
jgi:hypothetical protein